MADGGTDDPGTRLEVAQRMSVAGARGQQEAARPAGKRTKVTTPPRSQTAEDVAATLIRDAILGGVVRPGDHLNQERVATALNMSRIPVRAALRRLEAERLLRIDPFRGATVIRLTPRDIDEIYALRHTIECLALRHAAPHLTAEKLDVLCGHARYLDSAAVVDRRWITERDRFYEEIFALSGQQRTTDLVAALRREVGGHIAAFQIHHVHAGHVRFLEMLGAGDLEGAIDWHRTHLFAVRDRLKEGLESGELHACSMTDPSNPLHALRALEDPAS